jgi:hypothetical protein
MRLQKKKRPLRIHITAFKLRENGVINKNEERMALVWRAYEWA